MAMATACGGSAFELEDDGSYGLAAGSAGEAGAAGAAGGELGGSDAGGAAGGSAGTAGSAGSGIPIECEDPFGEAKCWCLGGENCGDGLCHVAENNEDCAGYAEWPYLNQYDGYCTNTKDCFELPSSRGYPHTGIYCCRI